VSRKGDDPSLWRRSAVLEVPTRDTELPAKGVHARETVVDVDFESVPRALLEAAVAELPVPRDTKMGEMTEDDNISCLQPALEEVMRNFAELTRRLLEIQSYETQRSPELIAEDGRLMNDLQRRSLERKPPHTVKVSPHGPVRERVKA
jgi:hypothetical protein